MNQEEANLAISKLGIILLLDSPQGIQFGIDNSYWKTGSKFKGVKLIPHGSHYIHYSLKDENYQYKIGFFINISSKDRIVIKRWSEKSQDFLPLEKDEEGRYLSGVINMEFDKYLGPYPLEDYPNWKDLSNYIDQELINKLDRPNENKLIDVEQEYEQKQENKTKQLFKMHDEMYEGNSRFDEDKQDVQINEQQVDDNIEAQKKEQEIKKQIGSHNFESIQGTIFFTNIPLKKVIHGVTGQDLTKLNFDKSTILQELLKTEYNNNHKLLLGEFQYAYITFFLGENFNSFEQWKKIFILLTQCDEIVYKNPKIFIEFIPVIFAQLKQFPKDFFIDNISSNNFMRQCLENFIILQYDESVDKILRNRLQKLTIMIREVFQFNEPQFVNQDQNQLFNYDPNDEDAPLILEDLNFIKLSDD